MAIKPVQEYREPFEVLAQTVKSLVQQTLVHRTIVVLAQERIYVSQVVALAPQECCSMNMAFITRDSPKEEKSLRQDPKPPKKGLKMEGGPGSWGRADVRALASAGW